MKLLTRFCRPSIVGLLLFVLYTTTGLAQEKPSEEFTPKGSVSTEYDRFEQKTIVALDNMKLERSSPPSLILFLRGYYSGGVPKVPSTIGLTIVSLSLTGYDLPDSCALDVISDGEHHKYELPRYKEAMVLLIFYGQAFRVDMPYGEFRSIANSKSVEMRLCKVEFTISPDQLAQFAEFRKRLGD